MMISNEEVFVISMCIYGLRLFSLCLPLLAFVYLCRFIAWKYISLFLGSVCVCACALFFFSSLLSSFFLSLLFCRPFRAFGRPFSSPTARLTASSLHCSHWRVYISFYMATYKIVLNVLDSSHDIHIVVSLFVVVWIICERHSSNVPFTSTCIQAATFNLASTRSCHVLRVLMFRFIWYVYYFHFVVIIRFFFLCIFSLSELFFSC